MSRIFILFSLSCNFGFSNFAAEKGNKHLVNAPSLRIALYWIASCWGERSWLPELDRNPNYATTPIKLLLLHLSDGFVSRVEMIFPVSWIAAHPPWKTTLLNLSKCLLRKNVRLGVKNGWTSNYGRANDYWLMCVDLYCQESVPCRCFDPPSSLIWFPNAAHCTNASRQGATENCNRKLCLKHCTIQNTDMPCNKMPCNKIQCNAIKYNIWNYIWNFL